jgi:ATPase subunit of ABC transporter with duplicated ATPase domains
VRDDRAREVGERKRDELQAFIAKNIGGGAKGARMAKSRQKTLAKMATFESAVIDPSIKVPPLRVERFGVVIVWCFLLIFSVQFHIKNPGAVSGGFGIRLVDVGFGFPGRAPLFEHVEFSINQNSRIW